MYSNQRAGASRPRGRGVSADPRQFTLDLRVSPRRPRALPSDQLEDMRRRRLRARGVSPALAGVVAEHAFATEAGR